MASSTIHRLRWPWLKYTRGRTLDEVRNTADGGVVSCRNCGSSAAEAEIRSGFRQALQGRGRQGWRQRQLVSRKAARKLRDRDESYPPGVRGIRERAPKYDVAGPDRGRSGL